MALAHNMLLRGLNSIYHQAPWVKPEDAKSFLKYVDLWCDVVQTHHDGEEDNFFPYVERATGVPGVMDGNLAQHKAFHGGMEALAACAKTGLADPAQFDGKPMVAIIDGFGPQLREHLADEVQTLLDLSKYGDKLSGIADALEADAKANFVSGSPVTPLLHRRAPARAAGGHANTRAIADAPQRQNTA
jgi:hypothetical protein